VCCRRQEKKKRSVRERAHYKGGGEEKKHAKLPNISDSFPKGGCFLGGVLGVQRKNWVGGFFFWYTGGGGAGLLYLSKRATTRGLGGKGETNWGTNQLGVMVSTNKTKRAKGGGRGGDLTV